MEKIKIGQAGMMESVLGQCEIKMSGNGSPSGFYLYEHICCTLRGLPVLPLFLSPHRSQTSEIDMGGAYTPLLSP